MALPAAAQMQIPEMPRDAAVRIGTLPNGMTYYIRHNSLPENRANFYIAQKVGSVQEEDNQRGLAHFLEHMCFNGSENFAPGQLDNYCESIGVKFGQNLNAYTSTDETVYNIDDVPVTESNIDSCLLILHDWADGLLLLPSEIDKERGVIHEEWRMRSSATMRIYERNLPTLYPGSRYGHRMPIGLMSIIDNFKPEELRAYYEKWYRPDLQGLIIVGDIDVDKMEAKIKALFSGIEMPKNAAAYEEYPVPQTDAPIYVIDKDKEMRQPVILFFYKHDPLPREYRNTIVALSSNYLTDIISSAFDARLEELSQKPDCPFLSAGAGDGTYLISKTMDAYGLQIFPKPGHDKEAVEAVMREVERVARFGFTASEIDRASAEFINSWETIYDNREKQRNRFFVQQYVQHFLNGEAIPDIETKFSTYKMLANQLKMTNSLTEAANQMFKQYTAQTDTNFVCLAMYPEKEGVAIPTADDFKSAITAAKSAQLEAYVDNVKSEPLISSLPAKGKIKSEKAADLGYTCWTLDNGARIYFKQTDFNDSQVMLQATSLGGNSKIPTADRVNAELMPQIINSTGLGNFTATELQKKLAGKQASLSVSLGESTENLSGSSTPKDLRTLFELLYLRFQTPANDPDAYQNTISMLRTSLENAAKDPMKVFSDSLTETLYDHNPLASRLKLADLDKADYGKIKQLYSERFNAAGDFDFFFTGAFNKDSLRLFVEQYIAPLKGVSTREKYNNRNLVIVDGVRDNHFFKEMETPQAIVVQVFSGDEPYTLKKAATVNALGSILTQRYLKSIREEAGIAYSVYTSGSLNSGLHNRYTFLTQCPVKPAKLDSALLLMRQGIEDIAKSGVTKEELAKVLEFELKDYADSQKKNEYWQSLITEKVIWGNDQYTGYEDALRSVSSDTIKDFVNSVLLKRGNCVTVSIRPTDFTEK